GTPALDEARSARTYRKRGALIASAMTIPNAIRRAECRLAGALGVSATFRSDSKDKSGSASAPGALPNSELTVRASSASTGSVATTADLRTGATFAILETSDRRRSKGRKRDIWRLGCPLRWRTSCQWRRTNVAGFDTRQRENAARQRLFSSWPGILFVSVMSCRTWRFA